MDIGMTQGTKVAVHATGALLGIVALVVSLAGVVGCSEADDIRVLNITPSSTILDGGSNTVVFIVDEADLLNLSLPLEWISVNKVLGDIIGAAGNSATYARTGVDGVNVVVVKDQFGAEGIVSVQQQ